MKDRHGFGKPVSECTIEQLEHRARRAGRMTKFRVFFSLNGVVEVEAETGEKAMDAISNINLIPYIKETEPYDFEEVEE